MTNLYLDTEFNGHCGDLISIALVADDESEVYTIVAIPSEPDSWVADHVLPYLFGEPVGEEATRLEVVAFVQKFDCPTIVCDFPTDLEHFFRLMRGPSFDVAYWSDMKVLLKQPPQDPKPSTPHNALSDARALREAWGTDLVIFSV